MGSDIAASHIEGEEDRELGIRLASDMEDGVCRGTYYMSKSKRIPVINMAKLGDKNKSEVRRMDDEGNVLEEERLLELDLDRFDEGEGLNTWISVYLSIYLSPHF